MKKTVCLRVLFGSLLVTGLVTISGTSFLLAQTAGTGALTGTVTDPSGALIPKATVTVTNNGTQETRTATTGADGNYQFGMLPPGSYRMKFSAKGFAETETSSIAVNVTLTTVLNQRLEIGSQKEVVQVTGGVETVQTQDATIGTLFEDHTIADMPLSTRNYTQLIMLSPGVVANVNNASTFGNGTQDVNVNGSGMSQNTYSMDGVVVSNNFNGGAEQLGTGVGIGIPNPDTIQEFKVQTSNVDASYGRSPGANVNVVTKSGTNALHGDLWEFFRNNDMDANDYFYKQFEASQGHPNAPQVLKQNQFGFTLGGPVKKGKLFFFGSYEGIRQINGITSAGYSPGVNLLPFNDPSDTTGGRDLGNSANYAAYLGSEFCPGGALATASAGTLHPYSGSTLSGTGPQLACDGSNISPVAINILQANESAGKPYIASSTNGLVQTVDYSEPARSTYNQFLVNTDYVISPKHTLGERFFLQSNPQTKYFDCTTVNGGDCLDDAGELELFKDYVATLNLTSVLTNNFVNEARVSFERFYGHGTDVQSLTNCDVGITPISSCSDLITPFTVFGYFATDGAATNAVLTATDQFMWADQISWTHRKHMIRAGFEAERDYYNWGFFGQTRGQMFIGSPADFLIGGPGNIAGTAFGYRYAPGGNKHADETTALSGFAQDDLKLNSRLTVNLGVRWEFFGMPFDTHGTAGNVSPSLAALVNTASAFPPNGTLAGFIVPDNYNGSVGYSDPLTGATGVYVSHSGVPALSGRSKDNFAPRIGFAWRPTASDRFVVRPGYGIFFDRGDDGLLDQTLGLAAPTGVSVGRGGPAEACGTLAAPFPSATTNPCPGFTQPAGFAGRTLTSELSSTYLAERFRTSSIQEYNLNLQYEFARNWVAEVGYVGSRSQHLFEFSEETNIAPLASAANPINGVTTNTVENAYLRVPILGFAPQGLMETADDGSSNYNSLQVVLRKQLSRLTFQAAYTFSRNLGTLHPNNGESGAGISPSGNAFNEGSNLNNPLIDSQHYGNEEFNRPQRFTVNYSWQLPGKSTGFTGKLLGGWALSGVTVVQDGQPITFIDSRGGSIYGTANNGPFADVSKAQFAPGMGNANVATSGSVRQRLNHYVNAAAFTAPPAIGDGTDFGDTGIGILLGPGQFNWDISLSKDTKVGGLREDARLMFRAEFFNAFNHPQFGQPVNDASVPSFGQITSDTVAPRIIQLALKYVF